MKFKSLALASVFAAVALPHAALALDPDMTMDVYSRPRPDFDARGVRLGSFMLYPTLALGVSYDDNVFNLPDSAGANVQEDFAFTVNPALNLRSNWSRHAFNIMAESVSFFYQDLDDEDHTDWGVKGDARFDITGSTNFAVDAHYKAASEDRSISQDVITSLFERGDLDTWGVGASINHRANRFRGSIGVRYDDYDYEDVTRLTANTVAVGANAFCPTGLLVGQFLTCNEDDRDFNQVEVSAKVGYEVSPGYALFIRGRYDERDYDSANPSFAGGELDDANRNKDSEAYSVEGGVDFELTRLLTGEVFVGYTNREYDAHPTVPALSFADTDAFTWGVDLNWYPTMMTTVSFDASRKIEESNDSTLASSTSGIISDRYGVRVDHELLRNLVIYGKIGFGSDEFEATTREDDLFIGGLGAVFLINNNLHLSASYDYVDRDSNNALLDMTDNAFRLSLTGKL